MIHKSKARTVINTPKGRSNIEKTSYVASAFQSASAFQIITEEVLDPDLSSKARTFEEILWFEQLLVLEDQGNQKYWLRQCAWSFCSNQVKW
ncbi:hypothetical protein NPIL_473121 [Nephila pilipes]|uniref:Uncharacterized protein n=1 Tax=Nephila pilipes TaxID=299642 RepID=A0A8X6QVB2_NEPPI|nr:hypothetical protein NPIL_473121 [Nephila pilipes]